MTTMAAAFASAQGIKQMKQKGDGELRSLQEWHRLIEEE